MTWFDVMLYINLFITLPLCVLGIFWLYFVTRVFNQEVRSQGGAAAFEGKLAVLVPTFNEAENIEMCLRSILCSDFSLERMTIYLNDDASSDATLEIASEVFSDYPECSFKIFEREHIGKAAGLQMILTEITEEVCILIDADTFVTAGCFSELTSAFADSDTAAISSCILIWDPKGWLQWMQSLEFSLSMLLQKGASAFFGTGTYLSGQVWAVRKSALDTIGGIPQKQLTEDYEMFLRFLVAGKKIRWSQNAVAYTRACSSIRELLSQRMRWWRGNAASMYRLFQEYGFSLFKEPNAGRRQFRFMFFDRLVLLVFSLLVYPSTGYLFFHWMPKNPSLFDFSYHTFFWFSALGPFRVLYNIPNWGINWFTLFGVLTGIFFLFLNLAAISTFRNIRWQSLICAFFLYPYFLLVVLAFPLSVPFYWRKESRYFID